MNRRAAFFAVASAACLVLAPVADAEFRWLPIVLGGLYATLALLVLLDALGRRNR